MCLRPRRRCRRPNARRAQPHPRQPAKLRQSASPQSPRVTLQPKGPRSKDLLRKVRQQRKLRSKKVSSPVARHEGLAKLVPQEMSRKSLVTGFVPPGGGPSRGSNRTMSWVSANSFGVSACAAAGLKSPPPIIKATPRRREVAEAVCCRVGLRRQSFSTGLQQRTPKVTARRPGQPRSGSEWDPQPPQSR